MSFYFRNHRFCGRCAHWTLVILCLATKGAAGYAPDAATSSCAIEHTHLVVSRLQRSTSSYPGDDRLGYPPLSLRSAYFASLLLGEAMAVNEPGWGSSADGKGEEGIDRSFERSGTPLHLGEQKSSLERGEQSRGEVVRVDVGGKF